MSEVHIKIYIDIIRDPYSFFIRPCFNLLAWTKVHVQFFELSWILTDSKQSEEQAPALQMSNYTCLIVYQCISQFQLHPGPPTPNPICICPHCQSCGWGICKSCAAQGPGICQPWGSSQAFDGWSWNWLMQNFIHLFMWQLFHLILFYFRLMLTLL